MKGILSLNKITLTKTSYIGMIKKENELTERENIKCNFTVGNKIIWSIWVDGTQEKAIEIIEKLLSSAKNLKDLKENFTDLTENLKEYFPITMFER